MTCGKITGKTEMKRESVVLPGAFFSGLHWRLAWHRHFLTNTTTSHEQAIFA
jgi:hypothetical protein